MLAFYKIFLFAFIAFGSFLQQGLCEGCHFISYEVYSLGTSAYLRFEVSPNNLSLKEILFNEKSIEVVESKTISNNNFSSLLNLKFFSGRKLKKVSSHPFNFSHVSFLELDLPPPNFLHI